MICDAWFLCDDHSTFLTHFLSNIQHLKVWLNVHISIKIISVMKWKLLLQKCLRGCIWQHRVSAVLPVRIHTSRDQIAPEVSGAEPCKHISLRCGRQVIMRDRPMETYHCEYIWLLGNQNKERLGWRIHTMSSVAEPVNDRGADGLNEELTASMNCLALNAESN